MNGIKEILIFIQHWIYRLPDQLTVFTGAEAQYDTKQRLYRESQMEHKFVAESIPALADACRGDLYRVRVREELDPQYGYQWRIISAERKESAVVSVIRKFMVQIGEKSLTAKRREALIKAHGPKTLDAILETPSALNVLKISPNGKRRICCAIAGKRGFTVLLNFLAKRKWDCRWALPLYERHKDNAILVLRTDPYVLYQHKLYERGLTNFRAADRVFLDDGGAVNAPLRCQRAVMAALYVEAEQNGGAFIPRKELRRRITPLLGDFDAGKPSNCTISEASISKALNWLEECGEIHTDRASGSEDIYLSQLYYAEVSAAEGLTELCKAEKPVICHEHEIDSILAEYEASNGVQLAPEQCKAVKQMLTDPVCVVTGGPGTGKTLLVKAAIYVLQKLHPKAVVWGCAPTGKAAENMSAEAYTIDRLVQNEKWKHVNRTSKREPGIIFVDEVSMVGMELFSKLLAMIPAGARLVLIGDPNQLPSIQAGQLLRDLIESDVIRTIHLHKVFRQVAASAILSTAEKIINTAVDQDIYLDEKGEGFAFNKHIRNPHRIPGTVIQAVEMVRKAGTPFKGIQVIPSKRHGEYGADNMNYLMQNHFNPQGEENRFYYAGKEFRLHDRVIHIKNNYDKNVFNGEIGEIIEVHHTRERALIVQYPSKTIPYAEKDLEELELAYALTVHKCQGSEFSVVIIPVAGEGNNRRSLYTAVTRGRKLVLQIGTESALTAEMRGESSDDRASHLALRLRKLLPPILPEVEQTTLFPAL